jgi:hypothetical protein
VPGRIGAQNMVIGQQVLKAKSFNGLGVRTQSRRVRANLSLRKDDANLHTLRSWG